MDNGAHPRVITFNGIRFFTINPLVQGSALPSVQAFDAVRQNQREAGMLQTVEVCGLN